MAFQERGRAGSDRDGVRRYLGEVPSRETNDGLIEYAWPYRGYVRLTLGPRLGEWLMRERLGWPERKVRRGLQYPWRCRRELRDAAAALFGEMLAEWEQEERARILGAAPARQYWQAVSPEPPVYGDRGYGMRQIWPQNVVLRPELSKAQLQWLMREQLRWSPDMAWRRLQRTWSYRSQLNRALLTVLEQALVERLEANEQRSAA